MSYIVLSAPDSNSPSPLLAPNDLPKTFFTIAIVLNVVPQIWEFLKSFATIERCPTNIAGSMKEKLKKVELAMRVAGKCCLVMEDALEHQLFISNKVEFEVLESIKEAQYNTTLESLCIQKAKKTWHNFVMFNNKWLETVLGREFYWHQLCLIQAHELEAAFKMQKNVWLEAFKRYLGT
ncbi:hypothetical protein C8R43DRAFT_958064 [Mycena crocata]|nr:hypothetical protein C8R43DRAFT_958064 [Mycena crocata]